MKKTYLIIAFSIFNAVFSQGNPESLRNLPEIIPPSPTVNSLMKFEEIPVSNYTGVPSVSIPIASLPTGLKDVGINIGLQYHIYNAKPEDKASEVGLGWSLSAGGTISRTVMGSPDEKLVSYNLGGGLKIGIYLDETTGVHAYKNYFHTIIEDPGLAAQTINTNKYIFEAHYKNRFDTQYDLYQYNFLDYTGRFVVKKVGSQLNVVKLDKNNLKIKVIYDPSTYEPNAFTITDDKGNIYVFDMLETSSLSTFSSSQDYEGTSYTSSTNSAVSYNSAFHLSKIQNMRGENFALFRYADPVSIVSNETSGSSNLFSDPDPNSYAIQSNKATLPRKTEANTSMVITGVRKLTEIELPGQGKVNFEYESGREDTNYGGGQNAANLAKLKSVRILSNDSRYDQKYNLNYVYNQGGYKRLFLASVEKTYKNNSTYNLEYRYALDYYPGGGPADEWEFYNCKPETPLCGGILPPPGNASCGGELLKSITYPTKGKAEFNYQTNTYSYAPQVLNFDDNDLNWNNVCAEVHFTQFGTEYKYAFSILQNGTDAIVTNNTGAINPYPWQVEVFRKEGTTYIPVGGSGTAFLPSGTPPPIEFQLVDLVPGDYYFRLTKHTQSAIPAFNAWFNITYREKNLNNYQYLYGGGIRIGSINYYNQGSVPERTISYDYMDINNPKKSSGGLVFPVPVRRYTETYKALLEYPVNMGQVGTELFQKDITRGSNRNFIQIQKTKGGDIGYQYVTVSETGKGRTVYTYTSPADHPSSTVPPVSPPFFAVPNNDFERGNLLNKKVYDNHNNPLTEDKFQYAFNSFTEKTGGTIRTMQHQDVGEYLYGGKYNTYEGFVADNQGARAYLTPEVAGFLSYYTNEEMFGTAHLVRQESIQYFPGSPGVTTSTDYVYNPRDYPVKETVTHSDGVIRETNYQYAHEKNNQKLIAANIIGVPLEASTSGRPNASAYAEIISRSETKYDDINHTFPTSALSYDIQNNAGTAEVTYNQYDNKGNIVKYTTKDGVQVYIVWGYDQTRPVMKIEGEPVMGHDYLTEMAEIQTLSAKDGNPAAYNLTPAATETELIARLDAFRIKYSTAKCVISTYTYDPLTGITTVTPPSGLREVYQYDTANRLEKIVDVNGKVLKEFKYNYKN
ncbi:hypothetical protein HNP38_003641 [Chryseobacterium defluvii]|uniref:YD repeat-containing protein n=1 Tax=Chryseobacterium defluvii TaxID=160396 RepID=A0A840KFF2_9FLAO|nr:RHS repeat domain-containing protein [Chryseobacterium defluvii]MBB4808299.1 hypothetical protein [Chryseobacterium defluvii]